MMFELSRIRLSPAAIEDCRVQHMCVDYYIIDLTLDDGKIIIKGKTTKAGSVKFSYKLEIRKGEVKQESPVFLYKNIKADELILKKSISFRLGIIY